LGQTDVITPSASTTVTISIGGWVMGGTQPAWWRISAGLGPASAGSANERPMELYRSAGALCRDGVYLAEWCHVWLCRVAVVAEWCRKPSALDARCRAESRCRRQ